MRKKLDMQETRPMFQGVSEMLSLKGKTASGSMNILLIDVAKIQK